MDTTQVIWIVVAVVVVLVLAALVWMAVQRARHAKAAEERRVRTERASELRAEADHQARVLPDAELRAKEEQVRAEKLRLDAERAEARAGEAENQYLQQAAQHEDRIREADRLDPDARAQGDKHPLHRSEDTGRGTANDTSDTGRDVP